MPKDLFSDLEAAVARRDLGIERAAHHANRVSPEWTERAVAFVLAYAATASEFLTEEVVAASREAGIEQPPDGRAWGAVMQAACRRGIIEKNGYRPAKTSNLCPKVLWVSRRPS